MAHDSHAHDAHTQGSPGKWIERRFTAEPSDRSNMQALVGGLGAAALGAGTFATWIHDAPMPVAPWLFVGGTVGLVSSLMLGGGDTLPLRVGDAGVAVERGADQPERLPWYEIEKVRLEGDKVVVEGGKKRIVAPAGHHAAAAGWILKEALARIPKKVALRSEQAEPIVRGADPHAPVLSVQPPQVAGRRCKASNAILSFERDAFICERCGEVYDKKHVPAACLTCEGPLAATK